MISPIRPQDKILKFPITREYSSFEHQFPRKQDLIREIGLRIRTRHGQITLGHIAVFYCFSINFNMTDCVRTKITMWYMLILLCAPVSWNYKNMYNTFMNFKFHRRRTLQMLIFCVLLFKAFTVFCISLEIECHKIPQQEKLNKKLGVDVIWWW